MAHAHASWETPEGIEIRGLDTVEAIQAAAAVLAEVRNDPPSDMLPNLMRALAYGGNYAVGLYDQERLIGASIGFFGPPAERVLHSHLTGVLPEYRHRGLGRLLKQHQREWAFSRELGRITWTFDPLVARNAHFFLSVLGAKVTDYLVNQYGDVGDNGESDRLFTVWSIAGARANNPAHDQIGATLAIPRDIERIRVEQPAEAERWRRTVREQFLEHLGSGLVVGGFRPEAGYLFIRPER